MSVSRCMVSRQRNRLFHTQCTILYAHTQTVYMFYLCHVSPEVGHNLNLAHSGGLDGRSYTDHTCIMVCYFVLPLLLLVSFQPLLSWHFYTLRIFSTHSHTQGNPYYEDDEGVMCYNPAKNFHDLNPFCLQQSNSKTTETK